jgi:hypothetical protein
MPKITYRGIGPRPQTGAEIVLRFGIKTTIGAAWNIVDAAGKLIAKARVIEDLSEAEKAKGRRYMDPRRDPQAIRPYTEDLEPASGTFGTYKLKVEQDEEDLLRYSDW